MENYSQMLKSWTPTYNMNTFFLSNNEFHVLSYKCYIVHINFCVNGYRIIFS